MDTWDNHAASGYAGGTGTSSNPYRIETAEQLAYMANQSKTNTFSGVYFSLTKNIDLSEYLWTGISRFYGNFNGDYNCISGMTMYVSNLTTGFLVGLFKQVDNAVIRNIVLKNCYIYDFSEKSTHAGVTCGAITGYQNGGLITNCVVDNFVVETEIGCEYVGGLVGQASAGSISNCIIMNSCIPSVFAILGDLDGDDAETPINCLAINMKFTPIYDSEIWFSYAYRMTKGGYISGTYIYNGVVKKIKTLYGSSSDFGGLIYSPNLNNGYPIPKSLLTIAPSVSQTSAEVYNYLVGLGFTAG